MPAKNTVREYQENSFYHIYNRGVAKQEVFFDQQDYKVFINYLNIYLTPISLQVPNLQAAPTKQLKNYFNKISLHCFCLMPNHFHLLLHQGDVMEIPLFLKSLQTRYSMYFNKKYKRVGPVFQGKYKAVQIESEEQFLYISKYVHRNPLVLPPAGSEPAGLEKYKYSSYQNYLGLFHQNWLKTKEILSYFTNSKLANSYKTFVEETDESDILRIKNQVLDIDG